MEELTWKEVENEIESGKDTVLILLGSIEQHGPHLPLNTDTLICQELGTRVAKKLGDALVAPVIRPGCSEHHLDFSGTISFPEELMVKIIHEYCVSLDKHGFRYIVLIPFHGGNFDPVKKAKKKIKGSLKNAELIVFTDLELMMNKIQEGMKKELDDYKETMIHAGGGETAVVRAIDEKLVREDKIEKGYEGELSLSDLFVKGLKYFTQNGVLGDPSNVTSEAGNSVLETISDYYVNNIKDQRK